MAAVRGPFGRFSYHPRTEFAFACVTAASTGSAAGFRVTVAGGVPTVVG